MIFSSINIDGQLLSLKEPEIMGILNLTPDSFHDGARYNTEAAALKQAEKMLTEGAKIIDVGGMSSRPGAALVEEKEEQRRILSTISAIRSEFPTAIVSVDTVFASTARSAADAGAQIINDISAGTIDAELFKTVADLGLPYILMHMLGTPKTMQFDPKYENLVSDIIRFLHTKIIELRQLGIKDIIIDPGFGFGKKLDHNYRLLNQLSEFSVLGCPLLVGLSRKSMIYKLLGRQSNSSLNATTAAHMVALQNGAKLLRVHDVQAAMDCIKIFQQLNKK
ncbi:dihydropteroate synthase [Chitinophagales bacterium]|nr:dihydropteroate synthase [Chitinophagales bacterium]